MSTLKANGVVTDPAARADWLAQAEAAAATFASKPGRSVVIVGDDATGALRLRAELNDDAEGQRTYGIVQNSMVSHNVEPGSWIRLTSGAGAQLQYREWPPMPTG